MSRVTSRTDSLQRPEIFQYDVDGNLHQSTDREGQVTTRTYDALKRLAQIAYSERQVQQQHLGVQHDTGSRHDAARHGTRTWVWSSIWRVVSEIGKILLSLKWAWGSIVLVVCVVAVGAQAGKRFSMPDSVLLFGDYNQLHVVTPGGAQLLRPPVDEGYNRGYFAYPSMAPRGDVIAWGFATGWDKNRPENRARFALGLYVVADQKWRTYGDFDFIGDTAFSADGTSVAFVAKSRLLIFDIAAETFRDGPYQRGMQSHTSLSWSPDATRLLTEIRRGDEASVMAVLDLTTGQAHELGRGYGPRWSPNGEWIAYYAAGNQCVLVHPDGTGSKIGLKLKDGLFTARHFRGGARSGRRTAPSFC
jgi:YD repeat-containing protein